MKTLGFKVDQKIAIGSSDLEIELIKLHFQCWKMVNLLSVNFLISFEVILVDSIEIFGP